MALVIGLIGLLVCLFFVVLLSLSVVMVAFVLIGVLVQGFSGLIFH